MLVTRPLFKGDSRILWDSKDLTADSVFYFQKNEYSPHQKYFDLPEAKSIEKAREQQVNRAIKILQLSLFKGKSIAENTVRTLAQF